MEAAGLTLPFLILTFLTIAAASSTNQIQILNAERRVRAAMSLRSISKIQT